MQSFVFAYSRILDVIIIMHVCMRWLSCCTCKIRTSTKRVCWYKDLIWKSENTLHVPYSNVLVNPTSTWYYLRFKSVLQCNCWNIGCRGGSRILQLGGGGRCMLDRLRCGILDGCGTALDEEQQLPLSNQDRSINHILVILAINYRP